MDSLVMNCSINFFSNNILCPELTCIVPNSCEQCCPSIQCAIHKKFYYKDQSINYVALKLRFAKPHPLC